MTRTSTLAIAALWALASCDQPATPDTIRAPVVHSERVSPTTTLLHRSDGSTTAVISAGPRAFRAKDEWRPIDTSLRPAPGGFASEENLIGVRFPRRLGAVRFFEPSSGLGLEWTPSWREAVGPLAAQGDVARYGVGPGVTEEFRVLRGGVKHNLVLDSREAMERALLPTGDGRLAVGGLLRLDEGVELVPAEGGALELRHGARRLFTLPAPKAMELTGLGRTIAARYRWNPEQHALAVEVDEQWLRAPERTFPLAVDPPATVLESFCAIVAANAAAGPGILLAGPDALRVGALSTEYYQSTFKFDLSAIDPTTTVTAASVNVFFSSAGTVGSQDYHFARLTLDPETGGAVPMWQDGLHGTNPDYAVVTAQTNNCGCWINGGVPATQTGTNLGATAIADLQAALQSRRFLLGMHVPTFVLGTVAYPNGILDPNEPQLYVDFTTGVPTVSLVTPDSTSAGTAITATVIGAGFKAGTTAQLRPVGGGAATAATVTYSTAAKVRLAVPATLAAGLYDVVLTTTNGSSVVTAADRFTVRAPAKVWNGSASSAWSAAANWTPAGVPDGTVDVTIPAATPNACALDQAGRTAHSVTLTGGALTTSGNDLTVGQDVALESGTLDMTDGGTLSLAGNLVLNGGVLTPGSGTVSFANAGLGRQSVVATGRVLFDDFERGAPGWVAAVNSGSPLAWALQEKFVSSPISAWYQQGQQLVAGSATLTSPAFSLAGKATATLRWKHRYRISLENGTGPNSSDGFVVQVSTNGGTTWTTIAPTATSVGQKAPKSGTATCPAGGTRTANPVVAGAAGLFAGSQTSWVQETVSLTPQAGQANVQVRFWSGWDSCNDFVPWDGVYVDDVEVTGDEAPVAFNHLTLSNAAHLGALVPLQVAGNLTLSTANTGLDLLGSGLTVGGALSNAGSVRRGSGGAFTVTGAFSNAGTFDMGTGAVSTGALTNAGTFTGGSGALTVRGLTTSGALSTGDGATTIAGPLSILGGSVVVRGPTLDVSGNVTNGGLLDTGAATTTLSSPGPSTVSGNGAYRQSAQRQVLFFDGFESGSFTAGGWVRSAGGSPPDSQVVATPPGVGASVANLSAGGAWIHNWITKALSTAGATGLWVTFGRATSATADVYRLDLEYSTDGAVTWKVAKSIPGPFTWTTDAVNLSGLDPAVDNNPLFQFRFHAVSTVAGNAVYVDEVRLEAGTPGLGPLVLSGGGTKTIDPSNAASALIVAGPVSLNAGQVRVATTRALRLDGPLAAASATAAGTTLSVDPGGTLALSALTTLTVGGALSLQGTSTNRSKVASTDPVTPGRYALTVSGTFTGSYFDVDSANALGLNLAAGCAVPVLDFGDFHRPPPGGALLRLGTATPPSVSTGCTFNNEAAVAGAAGVDGSPTPAAIRFDRSGGGLAGEAFDRDFGGVKPGNVTWGPTQLVFTTAPLSVAAGSCSAITVQARDPSGVPADVGAGLAIGLTAMPDAGVGFFGTAGCGGAPGTSASIPTGASSVTFFFQPTLAGAVTVTAQAPPVLPATQVETVSAGPAAKLTFTAQPSSVIAGSAIAPAPQVTLGDAFGNVVSSSTATVTLALGANPGNATLSGSAAQAATAGVATFAGLSLDKAGLGYTLRATSGVLPAATSAPFDVSAGPASKLAFAVQPANGTVGVALSPPPQVSVLDPFGNQVPGATAVVTVTLATNPGGATLGGSSQVAAANGTATFTALTLDAPGTGYVLSAAAPALSPATSTAFAIAAAPPRLALSGLAPPVVAGAVAPLVVEARDTTGALVTTYAGTVHFSSTDVAAVLPPDTTFTTADRGSRTLPLTFNTVGAQTVTATDLAQVALPKTLAVQVLQKASGSCLAPRDCGSGFCVGGVCCATACTGACQSCALPGQAGTCAPLPDGTACPDGLYCNGVERCSSGACLPAASPACVDPLGRNAMVCDEATKTCSVQPNAPPKVAHDANPLAAAGHDYAYNVLGQVGATGSRPMTFGACAGPTGFKVEPRTGAVSWRPAAAGSVPLCVKATNAFGSDTYDFTVTVGPPSGAGPTATFIVTPDAGLAPLKSQLDATGSTASPLLGYRWDYGDMSRLGTGLSSPHEYFLPGGVRPELTVVDGFGRTASAKRPVRASDGQGRAPPSAAIVASALEGADSLTVDFSCDCQLGAAPILARRWEFPDGLDVDVPRHTFGPGRHRVRLVVVDANGLTASDSVFVTVTGGGDEPPDCRAFVTPPAGPGPLGVSYEATFSDRDGTVASNVLEVADAGSSGAVEVRRELAAPGRYPARVTVIDDKGLPCTDFVEAVVVADGGEVPPLILSVPPPSGSCDVPYQYQPVVAGTGPFTFALDGPPGAALDPATGAVTFTATAAGYFPMRVTVQGPGGSDAQAFDVKVDCHRSPRHYSVQCGCGAADGGPLVMGWALMLTLRWWRRTRLPCRPS